MEDSQETEVVKQEVAEIDVVGGKTNKQGFILIPQPSNDPNEPLNWPQREKYRTYLVICWFTCLAFCNSSALNVAIVPMMAEFGKNATQIAYVSTLQVLFMGFGALVWMPLIRIIGKRPGYLAALFFLCVTNLWGFFSTTYGSLLASRILGGFLTAAADAPVPSVVAELFFFHERGHTMMFFNLALSSGAFLGPVFNGYITQYWGWKWICGVMAILSGTSFLVALLLLVETAYVVGPEGRDLEKPAEAYAPKKAWRASLGFSAGYDRHAGFFTWMGRTIALIAYPPIVVAGLICGLFIGWYVDDLFTSLVWTKCNIVVQLVASQTFTKPPWNWTIHNIGLLSISGFIGAAVSFFVGGRLIDLIATRMTARRGEHAEPEFRLPAMVIPAVIGPMGILAYGLVIAARGNWGGAAVGYGMVGFAATAASNIIITYAVDAYRPVAGETIVIVFVIRNVMACLIATYISLWIEQQGQKHAFGELVGVAYIILSLCLVLFIFGRKIRDFTMRFGPMAKFDVR